MDDFIKAVHELSTIEIKNIISEQQSVYSPEEFEVLKNELAERERQKKEAKEKAESDSTIKKQEEILKEKERQLDNLIKAQEKHTYDKIQALKEKGLDCYYEYKVIKLIDRTGGSVNAEDVTTRLNELAMEGWRVRCSFANEINESYSQGGSFVINENVIILERRVKI